MIKRYSDHAANERTFLAWVRTAIAVMAFGFLIERFDLFLRYVAPQVAQWQLAPRSEAFANWTGLAFIVLGIAMIIIAGVRLAKTAKEVETDDEVASAGARFDLALAALIGPARPERWNKPRCFDTMPSQRSDAVISSAPRRVY